MGAWLSGRPLGVSTTDSAAAQAAKEHGEGVALDLGNPTLEPGVPALSLQLEGTLDQECPLRVQCLVINHSRCPAWEAIKARIKQP